MIKKGLLIVISGPSGVGKGTVRRYFMDDESLNLTYSISMTTRLPRDGEIDGKDYFFVDKNTFKNAMQTDAFLEYAEFVGNCYGTPMAYVEKLRNEGRNVVLEIEVQGMLQVKTKCNDAITIFIVPPSLEELERRIRGRRSEDEAVVKKRLEKAKMEMQLQGEYNYVVCNDQPEIAAQNVKDIIRKNML